MNCKRKGNRNEHKSIKLLEAAGYSCTKSGGSLGVFDVIAISADDVLLVQCKSNRWPSRLEMASIENFKAPANCRRIVMRWMDGITTPQTREILADGRMETRQGI